MLAIAAMAVLIDDVARGEHSAGFAVAYVCLRSFMLALYWRASRAVHEARPLIRFYGGGYGIGVAMWLASLAVEPPWRYVVWGIALAFELSLPPLSTRLHRRIPTSARHLPERWALFTLIVLGESVVAVAVAVGDAAWHVDSALTAVAAFTAVAAVWWLYFDRQADVVLRGSTRDVVIYSYAHLPLLMGLAAMSAGLRLLIERAGEDELGTGPSVAYLGGAIVFLCSLIATRVVTVGGPHRTGVSLKLALVAILLGLIAVQSAFPPLALAAALAVLLGLAHLRGAGAGPAVRGTAIIGVMDSVPGRPRLRGVSHEYAFLASVAAGLLLVLTAHTALARFASIVFAASVTAMFGVSAAYHRITWRPRPRRWMARADHVSIYLLIAGTYTPFGLLALDGGWSVAVLAVVWGGALAAIVVKVAWVSAPKALAAATGLVLGWVGIVALPQLVDEVGVGGTALLLAGGLLYTAGAVVYALRRPNPAPGVFGYHEVFHALVVAAVACHYVSVGVFVVPEA
jgi:hemolysin III